MDRLTATIKLPPEGVYMSCTEEQLNEIKRADKVPPREIYRRLQAYEDTGLTPEEITAMKTDNERLHRFLDQTEEIVQSAVSTPKNRDGVYCKNCDYLNTDSDTPYCCHSNMSTNGLDDWCYHGIKRKEQE